MNYLKVDSVELAYDGKKILQSIFIDCKQGEIVGLLGRNGCGKSSLLKIIFGTLKPDHKYISINDEYITVGYQNNRIAYLPQHNYLPGGIAIEKLARQIVDADYWDEFTQLPVYHQYHKQAINSLSGGELRQLEIMIILHSKADFILLDEPFTHVSPIQAERLKSVIRNCATRKGIIITDHQYRNILEVSDRVVLLTNGCTKHIQHTDELITYGYISGH